MRAPTPGAKPQWILPPGASQSAQTATRRAVARLVKLKLILVPSGTTRLERTDDPDVARLLAVLGRKYMVIRYAIRTTLGQQIVEYYGPELESGARIRWLDHLEELTQSTLAKCPYR